STHSTPMHPGAPFADQGFPPRLGTVGRLEEAGQHDFVAMERHVNPKSTADGPGLLRGFLGAWSKFWVGLRAMRVRALVLIVVSGLLHAGSAAADNSRMRAA